MASKLASTCGPCSYRNIEHAASMWCLDCKEGLCGDCKEMHSALKVSRSHSLILYGDVNKLPEIALNIREICLEHNRPLEVYCSDHQEGCCIKCSTTDHKTCTHVSPMEEITKTAKSSVACINIQERLNALTSKLKMIIEKKTESVKDIDDQAKHIKIDVQTMQTKVLEKLQSLFEKVKTDADEIRTEYETNTSVVIKTLTQNLEAALELQVSVKQIKENGSNLQMFLCLDELEKLVCSQENKLSVALENGELLNTELLFKYDGDFKKLASVKSIGGLTTEEMPLKMTTGSNEQCAIAANPTHDYKKITLEKKYTMALSLGSTHVTNCIVLRNNCMLFADFSDNKRLILFDANANFLRNIAMESKPFDIAMLTDEGIAISVPEAEKLVLLEFKLDKDNVVGEMQTAGQCYGIDYCDNGLAVAVKGQGIHIYNDDGTHIRTIPFACTALTFVNSNIAYIEVNDNVVRCCNTTGAHLWEWKLPEGKFYSYPSISSDGSGCLYVTERWSYKVFILSNDGTSWKELLKQCDGLCSVNGIYVNKKMQELLVCTNRAKEAVLYSIKEQ